MGRIYIIVFINLLNPSLILMLNNKYRSLRSNEYFLDTCCSLNENEKIYLSCGPNEKIRLNLIEIYYNSDEYCSSELYCCKYRTKCSRRITKYSSLNCDEKNSCSIDKNCLKIYSSCASIYGLYGQYITINYSCLPSIEKSSIINETNSYDYDQSIPFIVKLSTYDQTTIKNILIENTNLKSSPLFLILIIFLFLLLMFIIYCLADQFGKKVCRQNNLNKNIKTNIYFQHLSDQKENVQSNSSLPITRIYPSNSNNQYYNNKYPYRNSYPKYIQIEHDPINQQIYSTKYKHYFNYY